MQSMVLMLEGLPAVQLWGEEIKKQCVDAHSQNQKEKRPSTEVLDRMINQLYLGELDSAEYYFLNNDRSKIYLHTPSDDRWHSLDSYSQLTALKTRLQTLPGQTRFLERLNSLQSSDRLAFCTSELTVFQEENVTAVNRRVHHLLFYSQIDLRRLIYTKLRKLDTFYTPYLTHRNCRWESKATRENMLEALLDPSLNTARFIAEVFEIIVCMRSVQLLYYQDTDTTLAETRRLFHQSELTLNSIKFKNMETLLDSQGD